MKRIIFLLVLLIFIAGCAEKIEKPSEILKPVEKQTLPESEAPCPDGVCDDFEMKEGECPEDCKDVEGWKEKAQQQGQPSMPQQQEPSKEGISVKPLQSSYKTITAKPSGWFTTGQDADIMLSGVGFNNVGGPLQFNHPGGLATDGQHLILADRFNNRILIWNSLPTDNTSPDIVLGQKDFTSNNPGKTLDKLNWPVAVATDGKKLVVADTYNDRLLIWNSFPTKNGQTADIEITDELKEGSIVPNRNPKRQVGWPWAVWTDGTKLIVTSTAGATVLIWNSFPTVNNQEADISIKLPAFGTPRTIGSNGKYLVVGDHNLNGHNQGNYFWKNFPTEDNEPYDFIISNIKASEGEIFWGPTFTSDGKLVALGENLYIWNSFPENENDMPDLSIGDSHSGVSGYKFIGGDGSGIAIAGGKIYISLYNGNKIVAYNSIPQSSGQKPDFAIGSPDINTNTLDTVGFITNPVPVTDGKSLFISSDFDGKLSVWKSLPDENGAKPDFIYDLGMGPWDNTLFKNKLILAGKDKVYIWNSLPLNGELPDIKLERNIGSVILNEIRGVTMDDKYFYLSDTNKIHIWEGIPEKNTNPKFSIDALGATRLSSDGKYLVVAATEAPNDERIKFYKIDSLSSTSKPTLLKGARVNLPQDVLASENHLFIGDTGFNRVLIWNSIDDAVSGKSPDIILGEENIDDVIPEIGKDKLFWPAGLAFDGSYLWIGEFKFSGRILRFSVK